MRIGLTMGTAIGLLAAALAGPPLDAHDPFPSKYTYNEDVHPLLAEHCGSCHLEGGAAPMPVGSYAAVKPWAGAIVEQLQLGRMPPWFVDPSGPAIVGTHRIPARDLDIMLTWAAGGAPEGDRTKAPPPRPAAEGWLRGTPDATLEMEAPYSVPSNRQDEVREFRLSTRFPEARWIRAADLLPGTRSMVRDAQLLREDGSPIAYWIAGELGPAAPQGTAFQLPSGAALTLRVHYRKSWEDGSVARTDRSTIGLYFTNAAREIRTVPGTRLDRASRVLAVAPAMSDSMATLRVIAVPPAGARRVLLLLRDADPGWPRRYWLGTPVTLPAGTRIESPVPVSLDLLTP